MKGARGQPGAPVGKFCYLPCWWCLAGSLPAFLLAPFSPDLPQSLMLLIPRICLVQKGVTDHSGGCVTRPASSQEQ